MKILGIPFVESSYTSPLIADYLNQDPRLQFCSSAFPTLENLRNQAKAKQKNYPADHRRVLVQSLEKQYKEISTTSAVRDNIALLGQAHSVTVTTGHQLNLMTGPLYFIYKIITTIKLAQQLNAQGDGLAVVPIFWMATEDHDFDEINHFYFQGKKIQWNHASTGPVGDLSLESLQPILTAFEQSLGQSLQADQLRTWIAQSYGKATTLSEATHRLADALFGDYGLVCLDAHTPEFKTLFVPQMLEELNHQTAYLTVSEQIEKLQQNYRSDYSPQVNPREINLFYFHQAERLRIEKTTSGFSLVDHPMQFEDQELQEELERHPERFSPNVLLRPLYQEVILPNICYIGGGGELAYWLQLSSFFTAQKVDFPLLLHRNAALLITEKQLKKAKALDVEVPDLFQKQADLVLQKVRALSTIDMDLQFFKTALEQQFTQLETLAQQTDPSFMGSVAAQRAKQFKGIDRLEKRLLAAQKRKLAQHTERIAALHEALFPQGKLQERVANFSTFYLEYGEGLIPKLMEAFDPLAGEWDVLKLTFDKKES